MQRHVWENDVVQIGTEFQQKTLDLKNCVLVRVFTTCETRNCALARGCNDKQENTKKPCMMGARGGGELRQLHATVFGFRYLFEN